MLEHCNLTENESSFQDVMNDSEIQTSILKRQKTTEMRIFERKRLETLLNFINEWSTINLKR